MHCIQKNGGQHKDIKVLSIKDVSHVKVGDIVETLESTGHQHAMVVDNRVGRTQQLFVESFH